MLEDFFLELSLILIVATIISVIFVKLKQPTLVAFIFSGILLGSSFMNVITYQDLLIIFSELGIAFLLFLVGINLDTRIFRDLGKISIVTGIGQIIFTTIIGIIIATTLGFGLVESLFIAIALTFSSTIIIVKLLSDKNEINSLHGRISIGFLIVQDFVAIFILAAIATISSSTENFYYIILNFGILLAIFIICLKFLSKKIFELFSKNQELIFLGAIGWCFAFVSLAVLLGFSKEIGAFLAGMAIASLPFTHEISAKLKYLRDFFIVLFFIVLGSNLVFSSSDIVILPAIIFSVFVLVGNPIIVFLIMTFLGYKSRTSFFSGLTVAQISEFSLIIMLLAQTKGFVSSSTVAIITLVAVITITVSTYFIVYNSRLYLLLCKFIPVLKNKKFYEKSFDKMGKKKYDLVIIGFSENTRRIIAAKLIQKKNTLIIDFDPRALKNASKQKFNTIYGDISDIETINLVIDVKPKVIVSNITDLPTNLVLAKKILGVKPKIATIIFAKDVHDAKKLYKHGVNYVIVSNILVAGNVSSIITDTLAKKSFELEWIHDILLNYDDTD